MFVVDVSPSMSETKVLDLPPGSDGKPRTREVTKLEWLLEFIMLKVQEMVSFTVPLHIVTLKQAFAPPDI